MPCAILSVMASSPVPSHRQLVAAPLTPSKPETSLKVRFSVTSLVPYVVQQRTRDAPS